MLKRFAFVLFIPTLYALPIGPVPMNGEVSLSQQSERLTITASDQSLIHWKDFSLEPQETLQFIQPHSKATVINQVIEAMPSRLMGRMEANGQVILINPNGVLVGKDAIIDTGSFIIFETFLIGSCFIFCAAPLLIFSMRKAHWLKKNS